MRRRRSSRLLPAPSIACWTGMAGGSLVLVPAMLRPLRANVLKRTGFPCRSVKKWSTPKASSGLSSRWYPSDLTDQEWARLSPLIPPAKEGGRPRTTDMRDVLNALFYVDRTGCQWRALPHDFPPWSTVWSYFRTWRNEGTWQHMHTILREQVRVKQGREPTPSAAIIDSQSVKTSQKGGLAGMTAGRK